MDSRFRGNDGRRKKDSAYKNDGQGRNNGHSKNDSAYRNDGRAGMSLEFMKKMGQLSWTKKILLVFCLLAFVFTSYFTWIFYSLPELFNVSDYQPPVLTEVYDKNGVKVGEFFKQRRILAEYEEMPDFLIHAFISAEDGSFFQHKGLNYQAILRAFIANLKAGKKVQGGSTITQQLARTLLLSTEKTYTRKFKEAVLAVRMENSLTKQDILYIYLNQIYLGHGAYGVEMASQTYFQKSVQDLNPAEAALLAGLPKAPSRFSPVFNPGRAKSRQIYVLNRMREEGYLTEEEMEKHLSAGIKIFIRKDFDKESPYYLEAVRVSLLEYLDETDLLEGGLRIETAMDLEKQKAGKKALKAGLEAWDKRQGFRGEIQLIADKEEREKLLQDIEKKLRRRVRSHFTLPGFVLSLNPETEEIPQEFFEEFKKKFQEMEEANQKQEFWFERQKKLEGQIFSTLVSEVKKESIKVLTPWGEETLFLKDFEWAVPIEQKEKQSALSSSKELFQKDHVISVRVKELSKEDSIKTAKGVRIPLELYQEPKAESALISFDLDTSEITALVGGYDYSRSQFNRAYQARRQSGSVFKPFVYGAALERGFKPNSLISDSPLVFTPKEAEEKNSEEDSSLSLQDKWRPSNITGRFLGDILFRQALVRSLNVPTIKVIQKTGLDWVRFYVRRLGIFSSLNPDFTMALGSSSLTLYETLKAFSVFSKQGQAIKPLLIHKVESPAKEELLSRISLDLFFEKEIEEAQNFILENKEKWFPGNLPLEEQTNFQKRWLSLFKEGSDQLIPANTSYVLLNLLEAIVKDPGGTGGRARALKRPVGGKTGTTDGYYDAWFVGASPFLSTAVWVGYDNEKSLGQGETGSRTALPIWLDYMSESHKETPPLEFDVPDGVVFANIDGETGQLVSSKSQEVLSQAFIKGTEPSLISDENSFLGRPEDFSKEEAKFIRQEL